jgi:ferrochelatase
MSQPRAILLLAYGGPDSLDDVEPYVRDIRGGRPTPPEVVAEIRARYAAIGGRSPLLDLTRAQAAALQEATGLRTYVGMRHWQPRIAGAVRQMAADGVRQAVALCMAPHYSELSIGAYYRALDAALAEAGAEIDFHRVLQWGDEPLFLDALADLARVALERFAMRIANCELRNDRSPDSGQSAIRNPQSAILQSVQVLFTAHSLPARIQQSGDPYPDQLLATAEGVAARLGLPRERWRFAYQSAGRSPEPWLGPSLEEALVELAGAGHRSLLVVPVGFVADHVEILYDLDIDARQLAAKHGVRLERSPLPNAEPAFIAALREVIRKSGN